MYAPANIILITPEGNHLFSVEEGHPDQIHTLITRCRELLTDTLFDLGWADSFINTGAYYGYIIDSAQKTIRVFRPIHMSGYRFQSTRSVIEQSFRHELDTEPDTSEIDLPVGWQFGKASGTATANLLTLTTDYFEKRLQSLNDMREQWVLWSPAEQRAQVSQRLPLAGYLLDDDQINAFEGEAYTPVLLSKKGVWAYQLTKQGQTPLLIPFEKMTTGQFDACFMEIVPD